MLSQCSCAVPAFTLTEKGLEQQEHLREVQKPM